MKLKYFLISLVLVLSFGSVLAPDPYTHIYIVDVFCEHTSNAEALWCCENHRDLMYSGAMAPDAMIQDYYKGGGKNYRKMHNWGYTVNLIESVPLGDKGGMCYAKAHIFHQVPDAVSHNWIVPGMMSKWHMPNELIHIPTEYAIGVSVLKHNPDEDWFKKGSTSLDALLETENERLVDWEQVQMGIGSGIDMESRLNGLIYFVGGNKFFSEAYNPAPEGENKRYITINLTWGGLGLVLLIGNFYLSKIALNKKRKLLLVFTLPLIFLGGLLVLASALALKNGVTVISYGWKFFYKGLGGVIRKDEGDLVGASMTVLEKIWENPRARPSTITYKGETFNITEPHGFTALGYGAGGSSFNKLLLWLVTRFLILLALILGGRYLFVFLKKRRR